MIVLISGPAAAGKTTICDLLKERYGYCAIKSSLYLRSLIDRPDEKVTRYLLQEIGDRLDEETDFNWLVTEVAIPQVEAQVNQENWFVDSVRKPEQIERFSEAFPGQIVHCHITAPDEMLEKRLRARHLADGSDAYERSYAQHVVHPNEISARSLGRTADVVIDTSETEPAYACELIMKMVTGTWQGK